MEKLSITTFTDESGQDTQGKVFVVCTIIVPSSKTPIIESILKDIEIESEKVKKWYESGNKRRHKYIKLILEKKILNSTEIIYSVYKNKKEYITLTSAHIAKAILSYVKDEKYIAKIFIDKMDKTTIKLLQKDIKLFHIKYKKIRGLSDDSNPLIRLADAICGLIRDLDKKNIPACYRKIMTNAKEV